MKVYTLRFWNDGVAAEYGDEPDQIEVHRRPMGACDAAVKMASECDISYLEGRCGLEDDEQREGDDRTDIVRDFKTYARRWLESPEPRGALELESMGPMALITEYDLID